MRIGKRTEIARPIDEVFDYVADTRNETKWHPRVRSIEKTSEGPIDVGTTFRGDEYERPTHLRFTGGNAQVSIEAMIDFREDDGQTHGTFNLDLRPNGFFRLIMPLMAPMIRRRYAQAVPALKRALETGP